MDEALYSEYLEARRRGDDRRASTTVAAFVSSFADDDERARWTWEHLPSLEINRHGRLRHELYEGVVFPVLVRGYQRDDVDSLLWLAKTWTNLVSATHLWERIGRESAIDMLRRAYRLAPDRADVRLALLTELLRIFAFIDHEWPASLIWTAEEVPELLADVELARTLAVGADHEAAIQADLDQFEAHVLEFRDRHQGVSDG